MHARRYFFKALESDEPHMGPALHLIARLYAVEERAKSLSLSAEERLALRRRVSARLLGKLHQYLMELQPAVWRFERGPGLGRCSPALPGPRTEPALCDGGRNAGRCYPCYAAFPCAGFAGGRKRGEHHHDHRRAGAPKQSCSPYSGQAVLRLA